MPPKKKWLERLLGPKPEVEATTVLPEEELAEGIENIIGVLTKLRERQVGLALVGSHDPDIDYQIRRVADQLRQMKRLMPKGGALEARITEALEEGVTMSVQFNEAGNEVEVDEDGDTLRATTKKDPRGRTSPTQDGVTPGVRTIQTVGVAKAPNPPKQRVMCPEHNTAMVYHPEDDSMKCSRSDCDLESFRTRSWPEFWEVKEGAPMPCYRGAIRLVRDEHGNPYLYLEGLSGLVDISLIMAKMAQRQPPSGPVAFPGGEAQTPRRAAFIDPTKLQRVTDARTGVTKVIVVP